MSTQLKLRRGTTAQHSTFTGASGEVTVDTTKKTVVVHDGTTAGGVPLQKEAFQQDGTGSTIRTVDEKLKESVSAKDFGAVGDGSTDDATAINNAITAVQALGGGRVILSSGTFIVGATLQLPDNVVLQGAGQYATVIKLKASANCNIIQKKTGAVGFGAGLFDLTIDGNDANNTSGGVYWDGASSGRGPSFTFNRVTITKCRPIASPPSGEYAAVLTRGATWGVARDLDIVQNQYAVGWWHKGSDWQIDNFYLGPNGALYNSGAGTYSMIIQGGAGNMLSNCYFGGNGGLSQVFLWGAQRNLFVNCMNDNSWENGYYLSDLSGVGADNNMFFGGQISHSGGKTNNTFASVYINNSVGNAFNGVYWSGAAHTSSGNAAKYALQEAGTAGGNTVGGGIVGSGYLTNFDGRRAAGGSLITAVYGIDASESQILLAKKRLDVQGPYQSSAPSTSSVPLGRFNGGGAVSLWTGTYAYTNAWLQAIQDDGSNNTKSLVLNPLGGGVISGGALTPNGDNTLALGGSGARWSVVYAGTGTINTSDGREKQDVAALDDAEKRVAVSLKGLIKKFRFKDAVEKKGDEARIHVGVIAQEVIAAFNAEGLDAMKYGVVCYDEWPDHYEDVYDDEGKPTGQQVLVTKAGNRYGVRYEELLSFIISVI